MTANLGISLVLCREVCQCVLDRKSKLIQLVKKAIKEVFPDILTFTTHFTIKTSNIVLSFHYYVPTIFSHYYYLYLPFSTSTLHFLPLPHQFYLCLTPFYHLPHYLTPVPTPTLIQKHTERKRYGT